VGRPRDVELDRRIAELRALGFTYSMIAEKLGVSVATVKTRIYRMRKRGELKPPLSSSWDELSVLLLQAKMRVGRVHDEMKLRHPQLTQYIGELGVAVEALSRAIELAAFLKAVTSRQAKRW
jgi:orotate phosphoribosyltransferase-like protein